MNRKIDRLSNLDAAQAAATGIKIVQEDAKMRCQVDHGELRDSIRTEITQMENGVCATCYTTKAYARFVEFGTGPKGQENHAGISPDVNPVYHQGPWWIHESRIDKRVAEKYGWFYIDTAEGRFYQCTGQKARPFMYPALHDNREQIIKEMDAVLKRQIRSITSD